MLLRLCKGYRLLFILRFFTSAFHQPKAFWWSLVFIPASFKSKNLCRYFFASLKIWVPFKVCNTVESHEDLRYISRLSSDKTQIYCSFFTLPLTWSWFRTIWNFQSNLVGQTSNQHINFVIQMQPMSMPVSYNKNKMCHNFHRCKDKENIVFQFQLYQ